MIVNIARVPTAISVISNANDSWHRQLKLRHYCKREEYYLTLLYGLRIQDDYSLFLNVVINSNFYDMHLQLRNSIDHFIVALAYFFNLHKVFKVLTHSVAIIVYLIDFANNSNLVVGLYNTSFHFTKFALCPLFRTNHIIVIFEGLYC